MPTYLIESDPIRRIVEAASPAAARAHVAKKLASKKISTREAFDLAKEGLEIEQAGGDAATE